jgi:hypothetical protein
VAHLLHQSSWLEVQEDGKDLTHLSWLNIRIEELFNFINLAWINQ